MAKEKTDLVLRQKIGTNAYFFLDIKRSERSELFYNKVDGIRILLGYLEAKLISNFLCSDLIYQITEIVFLPICKRAKGLQINDDIRHLDWILETFDNVYFNSLLETEKDLPKYIEFYDYGVIFGKDFYTQKLHNKVVARYCLEELFSIKKFNYIEKQKVLYEINLGKIDEDEQCNLGEIFLN